MKIGINGKKKFDSPDEQYFLEAINEIGEINGSKIIHIESEKLYVELLPSFEWKGSKESRTLYYPDFVVETEDTIYFFEVKGLLKAYNGLKYKIFRSHLKTFEEQIHKEVKFAMIKYLEKKKIKTRAFMDYDELSSNFNKAKKLNKEKEKELGRKLTRLDDDIKVMDWKITDFKFEKIGDNKWSQKVKI